MIFLFQYVAVGRLPQNRCDHFWKFLFLPKASSRVLGKRVNRRAGYGLEIPLYLIFKAMLKE